MEDNSLKINMQVLQVEGEKRDLQHWHSWHIPSCGRCISRNVAKYGWLQYMSSLKEAITKVSDQHLPSLVCRDFCNHLRIFMLRFFLVWAQAIQESVRAFRLKMIAVYINHIT